MPRKSRRAEQVDPAEQIDPKAKRRAEDKLGAVEHRARSLRRKIAQCQAQIDIYEAAIKGELGAIADLEEEIKRVEAKLG